MTEPNAPGGSSADVPENPAVPESAVVPESADVPAAADVPESSAASRTPRATQGETPLYKGEPLEADRGPGLGCFWFQMILLGTLLVLTPLSVVWAWPEWLSAAMLIITLILLLFAGQTVIFLMRLVAADRRTRRVPRSPTARRTVGMLEDDTAEPAATTEAVAAADTPDEDAEPPDADPARG